jgi:nucleolar MIF4G domain-containing protein 1
MDASTRILLLPLKKTQRNEIARILVHCCSNESHYNPFYSLVAKRLCSSASTPQVVRTVRMGLQFNLWGAFREWGEAAEDMDWEEQEDDVLDDKGKLRKALNLAKFYGFLVAENVLSLQVLKVDSPRFLDANSRSWGLSIYNL